MKRIEEREGESRGTSVRLLTVTSPFDLSRTTAPVWWARGRWPNVDWIDGAFIWVGWESERSVWRSARQVAASTLEISGTGDIDLDIEWTAAVLGASAAMPTFEDSVLARLALQHRGLRPWSAGSLYEGVISSIVGQSISVAAAATTERRLFELFSDGIDINGRRFWPAPLPWQLASSAAASVRSSGVTSKRAGALVAVGSLFATGGETNSDRSAMRSDIGAEALLAISGIGPWTVRSARLWGIGDADAHPTGDVALLRAARRHYPGLLSLKDLDREAERWKPYRGWAARLLWIDHLGFADVDRG